MTTTFAQRKAARIERGNAEFEFEVVLEGCQAGYGPGASDRLGIFASRAAALEFAFGQVGKLIGHSAARSAAMALRPRRFVPTTGGISVVRVCPTTGARDYLSA